MSRQDNSIRQRSRKKQMTNSMRAMVLRTTGHVADDCHPLLEEVWPRPEPMDDELLVRVLACGVCHTELDEIEGRTRPPVLPVIPGHEVIGRVVARGKAVRNVWLGQRIGVAWIYSACGRCDYCRTGHENLCAQFQATGRDANGGYAEFMTVPARFAHIIPDVIEDISAAPMLCAGAVGYRALALTGLINGQSLGLTGFGASAHLVLQMVRHLFPDTSVHVFARAHAERALAIKLGAVWTGDTADMPPAPLNAMIDTTPAWMPVIAAMKRLAPGGRLVINAIRKEDVDRDALLTLDYSEDLWMEKEIKTVANVTRKDVRRFLAMAAAAGIRPEVTGYALTDANRALADLKAGRGAGARVLLPA